MFSYRLGTINDFHWGFKPVLSYSKPHTFSTSLGEEKERKNAFNLSNQPKILTTEPLFHTLTQKNKTFNKPACPVLQLYTYLFIESEHYRTLMRKGQ